MQTGKDLAVRAADGDKLQNLVRQLARQTAVVDQDLTNLFRSDLVELVDGAHDVARFC